MNTCQSTSVDKRAQCLCLPMPLNFHNEMRLYCALVKADGSDYNNRIERSIPSVSNVILLIKHENILVFLNTACF